MTMWLVPTGAFASQGGSAKGSSSASALSVANESGSDDAPATEPAVDDSLVGEGESTGQVESKDADSQISGAQSDVAGQPDGSATEAADSSAQNAVQLTSVDEPSPASTDGTHTHRICGDSDCADASHAEIEWTAWDNSTSLPSKSGSYYLTTDVTLSDTWNIWRSTDIKLCLNGHTIIGADGKDAIVLKRPDESSTILDITDCHEGDKVGKITHNPGSTGRAIENIGTLTLWNGNITGNTGDSAFGGIAVNNYREFNMRGGTISGNDGSRYCYGTVCNEGTFNMSAGSITNNLMQSGGGVFNKGAFNMSGGSITNNVCTWRGAGVYNVGAFNLSGNVIIAGNTDSSGLDATVYLCNYSAITVDGSFSTTSGIGISADKFNYDAVVGSADTSAFVSDDPNYALDPNGSNLKLVMYPDHSHAVCGESSCTDPSSHGSALTWTRWAYRTSLPSEAGSYSLERDVTLADTWVVTGDVKLCLNGHTITGPDGKDAIKVEAEGSLVVTDCQAGDKVGKITHNSGVKGRGIENYGTLALWNGSIQGNTAINSVSVISPGGGGVSNQGTFTMHGGQIAGNTAKNGGGVENLDSFSMSGGSITGNSTLEGGNGGGVYADEPISLSGDVVITGNKSGDVYNNVYLEISDDSSGSSGVTIKVAEGALGSAAKVGITANNDVTDPVVVTGSTNTEVFESDDAAYKLESNDGGNLVLTAASAHAHRICGEDGCTVFSHGDSLTWERWRGTTSLPTKAGNYYLTSDVTLSDTWECSDSIKLCLNGHTITGADGKDVIEVDPKTSLVITDCHTGDEMGKITHAAGESGRGIDNYFGTVTLWNGKICGNSYEYGGGVRNDGRTSVFNMYGGIITGNSALYGGGVRNDGTFNMIGGVITGNTTSGFGGGMYNNSKLNVYGDAYISGNKLDGVDDGAENNVYLPYGKSVAVEKDRTLSSKAHIGITAANSNLNSTVVTGVTRATNFSSDDGGYDLINDGNGGLKLVAQHNHAVCGKAACDDEGHSDKVWTVWDSTDSLPSTAGNYYLTNDVTLSSTWNVTAQINLCLNGKTITGANGQDVVGVSESASLTVTDCQEGSGKITHKSGETGRGVSNFGTFTLWSGSITGNVADGEGANQGAGVYSNGTFNMRGGSITGNSAASKGGGVYNTGTFNLSGNVTISDNTADGAASNACLYGENAITVEEGKSVSDAAKVGITVATWGDSSPTVVKGVTSASGFFSDDSSYVVVSDTEEGVLKLAVKTHADKHKICGETGCTDPEHGKELEWTGVSSLDQITANGNYYLLCDVALADDAWTCNYNVNLCLSGHTIYGASEKDVIVVAEGKSLAITDCYSSDFAGKITHKSGEMGCGIANNGTLTLWNGSIYNNKAETRGVAVYNASNCVFNMRGGSIADNTMVNSYYGTVYNAGTFNMSGGTITGNTAMYGSGVCNHYGATFNMSGGSITGNKTDSSHIYDSGGVYNIGTFNLSGMVNITGNVNNNGAANVYLNAGWIAVDNAKSLDAASRVGISLNSIDTTPYGVKGSTDTGVFTSDSAKYQLVKDGNDLKWAQLYNHVHYICGSSSCEEKDSEGQPLHAYCDFTAISSLSEITADGSYYLMGDVALDSTWKCDYNVNLCLNGKSITGPAGSEAIKVAAGASLAITDCHTGDAAGKITHATDATGRGITNDGTLTLWNGSITGNKVDDGSDYVGGGVYNDGAFTMNGGSVAGNTGYYGGGVYNSGLFTLVGGSVGENFGSYRGGGVYNEGTFAVAGSAISGNTAGSYGGGVYNDSELKLSGKVSIIGNKAGDGEQAADDNVRLNYEVITVEEGASLDAESRVGVCAVNPAGGAQAVAGSVNTDVFTSDDNSYELVENGDKTGLSFSAKTVEVSGVKLLDSDGGSEMGGGDAKSKVYDGLAAAYNAESATVSQTVRGAALVYTWQEKDGDGYADITDNQAPKSVGEYQLVVTYERDGVVFGASKLPFTITAKGLSVTAKAQDKTYDGTAEAEASVELIGAVGKDDVTATVTSASFTNKNAETGKDVTVGVLLSGADAGNYTAPESVTTKASITAKELVVAVAAEDKAYDGTTDANATAALSGAVAGDDVAAAVASASFANKNAGTGKDVTVGVALSGADAGNYTVATTVKTTATIAAKQLTIVGATVSEKTYDGTTDAKVTAVSFDGLVAGEALAYGADYAVTGAAFDSADVDSATKVGFSVALKDTATAKNYTLSSAEGSQPASIKKAKAMGYAVTDSRKAGEQGSCRIYVVPGGSAAVSVEDEGGIIDSADIVAGFLTYKLKDSATEGKTATVKAKVTSANYEDYEISVAVKVADKEKVEISFEGDGFTYSGKPQAPSISVEGAKVEVSDLKVTYYDEQGQESAEAPAKAGTYLMVASVPDGNTKYAGFAMCTFQIEPKALTATAKAQGKTYDGKIDATVDAELDKAGVVGDDEVTLDASGVNANFDNKDAGENKTVTLSGEYELSGAAAGNYTLKEQPSNLKANIARAELTVKVAVADKLYDGTNTASFVGEPELSGMITGDNVTLANGTPTFSTVGVGKDIDIRFTDFSISGADAGNYTLTQPSGIVANIKAYNATGDEYASTTTEWTNHDFTVTAAEGWKVSLSNTADGDWQDSLTCSDEGEGSLTFYVKNVAEGYISQAVKIYYKIDKTAPAITGAQDGNTYCGPVEITVSDANLDKVTVNGEVIWPAADEAMVLAADAPAEFTFTVQPAEGEQTVVATDMAGNSTTLKLTVNNGHTWGAWTSNGNGTHTHACEYGDSTETAECHGGTATCTDRAVCDDCGQPYGEVDPDNHAALTHVDAKAATTTAEGNIEYWYCEACGKYFADEAGAKEIQQCDTVVAKEAADPDDNKADSVDGKPDSDEGDSADGDRNEAKSGKSHASRTGDASAPAWPLAILGAAAMATAIVSLRRRHS